MAIFHIESGDYARATGGWVYNHHLVDWIGAEIGPIDVIALPPSFPEPSEAVKHELLLQLSRLAPDAVLVMDHIYACMFADLLRSQPFRILSIFHHSLAEEHRDAARYRPVEAAALALCEGVIVTSFETKAYVERHYPEVAGRVAVAPPGNDPALASEPHADGPWTLLSIGAVIPRKRYELALQALAALKSFDWSLTIVGNLDRYPDYVEALHTLIRQSGLEGRVALAGELSQDVVEKLWAGTHLYVASSSYEGYGMAISEALCRSVPVVSTHSGAVASWAGDGAVLVSDTEGMTDAIRAIVSDRLRYQQVRQAATQLGRTLPSWHETFAPLRGIFPARPCS